MTGYVAFLRAVNVGGRAIVRKDALARAFIRAGCREVETVIQSGNVLFSGPARSGALFRRIQREVEATVGGAKVFLRTLDGIGALVRSAPFGRLVDDRRLKLYVVFLEARPRPPAPLPLESRRERLSAIGLGSREVFVVSRRKPSGFYGFPNNFVEDLLGVPATSRNWSTITRIAGLAARRNPRGRGRDGA